MVLFAALVAAEAVEQCHEPDDVAAIASATHMASATASTATTATVTGTLVAAAEQKQKGNDVAIAVHMKSLRN